MHYFVGDYQYELGLIKTIPSAALRGLSLVRLCHCSSLRDRSFDIASLILQLKNCLDMAQHYP